MDKVKSAEVELNTLTQIEIEKTNIINENKDENKAMYKTLERSKRIFLEMRNLNLKKIKDLEEIIQTATFDIQIQVKDIEKSKKAIEAYREKESKLTLDHQNINKLIDNCTEQFNTKKSVYQSKLQTTIDINVYNNNFNQYNDVKSKISGLNDKIDHNAEIKSVLINQLEAAKQNRINIKNLLHDYKFEVSLESKKGNMTETEKLSKRRRVSRDEIDNLHKNISDLDMEKELALAKQNDIKNRLKIIKQLKDDKE